MAWFKRVKKNDRQGGAAGRAQRAHGGLVDEVRQLPHDALEKRSGSESARLPQMPASFSDGRGGAACIIAGWPLDGTRCGNGVDAIRCNLRGHQSLTPTQLRDVQRKLGMKDAIMTRRRIFDRARRWCAARWNFDLSADRWARWSAKK